MASIDIYSFRVWQGRMRYADRKVGVIPAAPGADGVGVVYGGWQAPVSRIRTKTVVTGDYTAGVRVAEGYRALVGTTTVTVVDQFQETWRNIRVLGVVAEVSETVITGQVIVTAEWRLLTTSSAPIAR